MLLSDGWLEEFQQCIIRKHNGHTLRWRYDLSHITRPCRHLVTASLCFRGLFFWDALYTRNRDSERSMINATILERRFERRLQTRFDYGYWNVILLLEKVINAPIDCHALKLPLLMVEVQSHTPQKNSDKWWHWVRLRSISVNHWWWTLKSIFNWVVGWWAYLW